MKADDLRTSILQAAIQGKLTKQDPNDEPASVLVERIRDEKHRLVKEGKIKRDKNESFIFASATRSTVSSRRGRSRGTRTSPSSSNVTAAGSRPSTAMTRGASTTRSHSRFLIIGHGRV